MQTENNLKLRDWLGNCAIDGKKCAIGSGEKHKSSM